MLFVGIGGIGGAITRYLLGKWITQKSSKTFPLGTWTMNVTGSFFLGIFALLYVHNSIIEWIWLLIGVGFLGSYTTFSTFGYETIQMLQKQEMKNAVIYVSTSVILGILFAWIGGWIVSLLA
ncbi:fluoride efflux transporter CrcB [Aquibacillus sp. 3ASR75-11]|uniref:Fluoride-specific ion channel FluC n=1 Tax=Terrihalobacillus insolitus TaxID=2950438 RepID=A0A9X3WPC1_9BACI|nr:fluoride efflux transporter CrcB [Terrihalobacillus insolitus]MDC3423657.1 fluoride efflux transporter CrcB [Terrihalobacillus insolitus]